jgi:aryl-alcohol dehydrogenase-like predicted oxidoreductase
MTDDGVCRIGLGTAQFGAHYGITNTTGQVPGTEIAAILDLAAASGIDTLDTAHLYAESESAIGCHLQYDATVRIVTKTRRFGTTKDSRAAVKQLRDDFQGSLKALRRSNVHALLLHDAGDLIGPMGPDLWSALQELRASGLVERIGVSVYEGEEIDCILDRYPIEIVQLPFNVLDRRLEDGGHLQRLGQAGVEVHARSLFLQGLLLAPIAEIPDKFRPIRAAVEHLDRHFATYGLSRLEGLLTLALRQSGIERFICGVTSVAELTAIILAAQKAVRIQELKVPELPTVEPRYLHPARWSELDQASEARRKDPQ